MSLQRRTPLRAKPRSKGGRAEREVIDMLREAGWPQAGRSFGSGRDGNGDVVNGPANCSIEIKHRERAAIYEWLAQCERDASPTSIPIVAFRRNRCGWYACLPLDDLLGLLKERQELLEAA